jgi:hypothetical protein
MTQPTLLSTYDATLDPTPADRHKPSKHGASRREVGAKTAQDPDVYSGQEKPGRNKVADLL